MAGIADPDQAIVEDRKIIHYLLSSTHPAGVRKCRILSPVWVSGIGMAEFT